MSVLKEKYLKEIRPALKKDLKLKNINQVPKLVKVVINAGIGTLMQSSKDHSGIEKNIAIIAGQKPCLRYAKKSVSNFKLRAGSINGITVTLRGERMYHFIHKLVNVTLPRVRDFRGIDKRSFDGQGNYSLGLKEHTVFPETEIEDETKPFGLQITIVTNTSDNKEALALLKALGFPFRT